MHYYYEIIALAFSRLEDYVVKQTVERNMVTSQNSFGHLSMRR
jgi:hypothetical protein